jgi:hypothetical protein
MITGVDLLAVSTFLLRARDSGGIGGIGLLLLILSIVLGITWLVLFLRRRRRFVTLGCITIIFSVCGYVFSDWAHFSVYLRIHDVQGLRNDCQVLMERREATSKGQYTELRLRSVTQLPLSFVRLGAERADVTPNYVGIYTMKSSLWKCNFGVVYIPDGSPVHETFRPLWYHNFYEFRPRGDE